MIIDIPTTNTTKVLAKLATVTKIAGITGTARVLNLIVPTVDGDLSEEAIKISHQATRKFPCRIIILVEGSHDAANRLDAQIRIGGDAGTSEVVILRLYGEIGHHGNNVVTPLLLPDIPVVTWWPHSVPLDPSTDPLGMIASRRITFSAGQQDPRSCLQQLAHSYKPGDTDLAWPEITYARAMLVSAFDSPPFELPERAIISGPENSPQLDLMAGWLTSIASIPVERIITEKTTIRIERQSAPIHLKIGSTFLTITMPGRPDGKILKSTAPLSDCLAEELTRTVPDAVYGSALKGLSTVTYTGAKLT